MKPQLVAKDRGELVLTKPGIGELIRSLLADGIPCRLRTKGNSMSPFIQDDDVVTILPPSNASPTLGKIAVCHSPEVGSVVIHRVIATGNGQVTTKGDNCSFPDMPTAVADVLGCVSIIERHGSHVRLGLGPERLVIAAFSRAVTVSRLCLIHRLQRRLLSRSTP